MFGPDGEWRSDVSGRLSADNGDALRVAALNGAGIVLQPEVMLADDLARGRLVQVLPEWTPVASPMYLLYALDRRPTAKTAQHDRFLAETLGTPAE